MIRMIFMMTMMMICALNIMVFGPIIKITVEITVKKKGLL